MGLSFFIMFSLKWPSVTFVMKDHACLFRLMIQKLLIAERGKKLSINKCFGFCFRHCFFVCENFYGFFFIMA